MLPVITRERTRSGYFAARLRAMVPPHELQTKSARSIPSSSSRATTLAAWKSHIGPAMVHLSDRPYCSRSTRIARRSEAKSGATGPKSDHAVQPGPPPCRKIVGSPSPRS